MSAIEGNSTVTDQLKLTDQLKHVKSGNLKMVDALEAMLGIGNPDTGTDPYVQILLRSGNTSVLQALQEAQKVGEQMMNLMLESDDRDASIYAALAGASRTDHEDYPYKREALVGFILQLQLTPLFKGVGQGQDIEASIKERFLTTVTVAANLILDRCKSGDDAQEKMKSFGQNIASNSEEITKEFGLGGEQGPALIAKSYCKVEGITPDGINEQGLIDLRSLITAAQKAAADSSEAYANVNTEHDATTVYSEEECGKVQAAAAAATTAAQAAAKIAFHAPGRAAAAALAEARANEAVVAAQAAAVAQAAQALAAQAAEEGAAAGGAEEGAAAGGAEEGADGGGAGAAAAAAAAGGAEEGAAAGGAGEGADGGGAGEGADGGGGGAQPALGEGEAAVQARVDAAASAAQQARAAAKEAKEAAEIAAGGGVVAVLLAKAAAETAGVTDETKLIKKIHDVLTSGILGVRGVDIEYAKELCTGSKDDDKHVDDDNHVQRIFELSATNQDIAAQVASLVADDAEAADDRAVAAQAAAGEAEGRPVAEAAQRGELTFRERMFGVGDARAAEVAAAQEAAAAAAARLVAARSVAETARAAADAVKAQSTAAAAERDSAPATREDDEEARGGYPIRAITAAGRGDYTHGFRGFVRGCVAAGIYANQPQGVVTLLNEPLSRLLPDDYTTTREYKNEMERLGAALLKDRDIKEAGGIVRKHRSASRASREKSRKIGLGLQAGSNDNSNWWLQALVAQGHAGDNIFESENRQLLDIHDKVVREIDKWIPSRRALSAPANPFIVRAKQIVNDMANSDVALAMDLDEPAKNNLIRAVAKHHLIAVVRGQIGPEFPTQLDAPGLMSRYIPSTARAARLVIVKRKYPELMKEDATIDGLAQAYTSAYTDLHEAVSAEERRKEAAKAAIEASHNTRGAAGTNDSYQQRRLEASVKLDEVRGSTSNNFRVYKDVKKFIKRSTASRSQIHVAARLGTQYSYEIGSKATVRSRNDSGITAINARTNTDVKALLEHTTLEVNGQSVFGGARPLLQWLFGDENKGAYEGKRSIIPGLNRFYKYMSERKRIATAAAKLKKAMALVPEAEDQESPLTAVQQAQHRVEAIAIALSCAQKLQTECKAYMSTRTSLLVADETGKHTAFSKSLKDYRFFGWRVFSPIYSMREFIYKRAQVMHKHKADGRGQRVELVSNLKEQVALQCEGLEKELEAAQNEAKAAMQAEQVETTEQESATQAAAAAAAAAAVTAASDAAAAATAAADAAITAASGAAEVQAKQLEAESALEDRAAAEKEAARKATEALAEKFHGIGFAPDQGGAAKSIVPELTSADDVKKQAAYGALLGWHTNGFTARDPASARANASTSTALCMSTAINMCGDAALDENGNATEEYVSACVAVALIMYVKSKGLSVELDNYGHQEAARSMVRRNAVVEVSKMKTQTLKERWELACATHARTTSPAAASLSAPRAAAEPPDSWWKRGAKPAPNETGADCAARVAEMRRMQDAYVTPCDEKLYKKVGVQGTALNRYRPCIGTFRIMSVLKQVSGSLTDARLAAHIGNVRVAMDVLDANMNPRWSVPERYDLYKVLAKHFVSFGGDEITENDVPWVIALAEDYRGCTDAWPTQIHRQTQHPGMEYSVQGGGSAASGAVASEYNAKAAINNCLRVFTKLPAVGQPYWADMNSELRKTASPPYYLQHVDPAATVISQLDAEGQKQVVTGVSKVMGYFVEPTRGGSTSVADGSFSKGLGPTNGTHGSKWDTLVNLVNDATVDDFDGKWSSVDRQDTLSYLGARSHPRDNRPEVGSCPPSVEGEVRYVIQSSLADLQVARDVVSQGASQIKGATACPDSDSVPYYSVPQDIYTRMQPTLLDAVKGEFRKLAARSDGAVVQAAELEEAVMKAISQTLANELSRLEYNIGDAAKAANDLIIEGGAHVGDAQRKTLFHSTLQQLQAMEPAGGRGCLEGPEAGPVERTTTGVSSWGWRAISGPTAVLGAIVGTLSGLE